MSRVVAPTARRASGPNCGTAAWSAPASASPVCCAWRGYKAVTGAKVPQHLAARLAPPPAPDLVQRQFTAAAPDRLWVADITYVPTWAGFLYLAVVLDVHSRRIVGWAMADHLRSELVIEAVDMAVWRRRPTEGVIHHSDQGSQYTSLAFGRRLREAGLVGSMGSRGDCFDNATAESFFATLECELLARHRFPTRSAARLALFDYIEGFYNTHRRHSALGYLSPAAYERRWSRSAGRHLAATCPPNRGNSSRLVGGWERA